MATNPPAAHDTRAAGRDSLFLQAVLRRDGDDELHPVRVRNLSSGGMMAEAGDPFGSGDLIDIELRGLGPLHGAVVWRRGDRIGIAFDSPVDPRLARKAVPVRPPASSVIPLRTVRRPKLFGA